MKEGRKERRKEGSEEKKDGSRKKERKDGTEGRKEG